MIYNFKINIFLNNYSYLLAKTESPTVARIQMNSVFF